MNSFVDLLSLAIFFVLGTAYGFWICERSMLQYKESSKYWNSRYMELVLNLKNIYESLIRRETK